MKTDSSVTDNAEEVKKTLPRHWWTLRPSVTRLMERHKINRDVAAEMYRMRD